MSIIERAIQKGQEGRTGKSRRATDAKADLVLEQAAAIEASVRLCAEPLAVDSNSCRERRLLLQRSDEGDGAAVARETKIGLRSGSRARDLMMARH